MFLRQGGGGLLCGPPFELTTQDAWSHAAARAPKDLLVLTGKWGEGGVKGLGFKESWGRGWILMLIPPITARTVARVSLVSSAA